MSHPIDFDLYLITDRRRVEPHCTLTEAIDAAVAGGVRAVELREKDLEGGEYLELAASLLRPGVWLTINDRLDVARALSLERGVPVGVHLTRRSIAADDARAFLGKDALIGVSTHALCEAQEAERLGADFVTFGPVFETPSKRAYGPPLGLEALKSVVSALSIPVFALGGVTCERLPALAATGVHGIAMISAILGGTHPAAIRDAAEELVTRWQGRAREGKPAPRGTPDAGHP